MIMSTSERENQYLLFVMLGLCELCMLYIDLV